MMENIFALICKLEWLCLCGIATTIKTQTIKCLNKLGMHPFNHYSQWLDTKQHHSNQVMVVQKQYTCRRQSTAGGNDP